MAYPASGRSGPTLDVNLQSVPFRTRLRGSPLEVVLDRAKPQDYPFLRDLLNFEIIMAGNSYPLIQELTTEQFIGYYCSHDLFVLRVAPESLPLYHQQLASRKNNVAADNMGAAQLAPTQRAQGNEHQHIACNGAYNFGVDIVGSVHIKPNFPGRCDHICNGAFLVVPHFRRYGAATILARRFMSLVKELRYERSMFNLVFTENGGSVAVWDALGYSRIGIVPRAGKLIAREARRTIKDPPRTEKEKSDPMTHIPHVVSDAVQFTFDARFVVVPVKQKAGEVASYEEAIKAPLQTQQQAKL